MTNCCIPNSALDAGNLGDRVAMAQGRVRGTNADTEDATLKMISRHIWLIVESRDLVAQWRRQSDPAAQVAGLRQKVASV